MGRQQQGEETWLSEPTISVPGGVADDLSMRLESSEAWKMPGCPEATSPIPGGVADDLLNEAGVLQQHGKCLAA